ncbi:MAG: hypothetical protein QM766_01015 [Burkholderiaceae bacterium]
MSRTGTRSRRVPLLPALLAVLSAAPLVVQAGGSKDLSPQDVAVLAATCFTCHGPGGQPPGDAPPDGIPALRGQSADRLLQRMRAFKASGAPTEAAATIMPLLLQGYDDAQIEALARWFGGQRRP